MKCLYVLCMFRLIIMAHTHVLTTPSPPEVNAVTADGINDDYPIDASLTNDDDATVVLESASGVHIPQQKPKTNVFYNFLPADFWQQVSPGNLVRPLQEKLAKLKEALAHTGHPNFGGVSLLSPQQVWEKLHEMGHPFLTGVNGAVFGLGNMENHDYPFAYRQL